MKTKKRETPLYMKEEEERKRKLWCIGEISPTPRGGNI